MISKRHIVSFLLLIVVLVSAKAQVLQPVTWNIYAESTSDSTANIIFNAKISPSWHLYSTKVTEGPIPTNFSFTPSNDYILVDSIVEISDVKIIFDKSFNAQIRTFENEAVFSQTIKFNHNPNLKIEGIIEFMACNDRLGCLPPSEKEFAITIGEDLSLINTKEISNISNTNNANNQGLFRFFWIAFFAGLAGILTPCVFPMIPMTVSFFLREEKRSVSITKAIVFGVSIILIYTLLGIILGLTGISADIANLISTHWISNLLFFALFLIFALSFLGMFEITLPSGIANKLDSKADKSKGFIAVFFMALSLVFLSFSCTGPIIGALLVESAGGIALKPILGMFGFSLAFSLPFVILAMFPSLAKKLPKSGNWLHLVKIVLGLLLLALSLKFISVIDQVYHLNLLSREVFLSIWITIFTIMGMSIMGQSTLHKDDKQIGTGRLILAITIFSFALYLSSGLFGNNTLESLSGILPPSKHSNVVYQHSNNTENYLCEKPIYQDLFSAPEGIAGYFDYTQGLNCAKSLNKPILLVFKGHACSNCKLMEATVWKDAEVLKLINENYIPVFLYVDDRTVLPESEWISIDGKVKKTIGQVNSAMEISKFNSNTIPLHVILDSNGKQVSNILPFESNTKIFINFLSEYLKSAPDL